MHIIYSHKYNTNSSEDASDMNDILPEHNVYAIALTTV